jgi:hypothetical protein
MRTLKAMIITLHRVSIKMRDHVYEYVERTYPDYLQNVEDC